MFHLFTLLLLPIGIGGIGYLISHYKDNGSFHWKELLVQIGVGVLLATAGFFIAMHFRGVDKEIWNGKVASKYRTTGSCCHSYPCNPHPCMCDNKGNNCSTCTDICYEHSSDRVWRAESTNDEIVYNKGCGESGDPDPARWTQIVLGEPTAVEHSYTNYIKGNPDSIMRRQGVAEKYSGLLPEYPRVYDHYRAKRFLGVGISIPEQGRLNKKLSAINGNLGAEKQVNIIIMVVKTDDQMYLEGLTEHWLGGKKNDVVVIIGSTDFPQISWAGVMSWSDSEDMKIDIRNRLLDLETFDGDKVLKIVSEEISSKFARKQMSDFAYLKSTMKPSDGWLWFLYLFGLILAGGLQTYFWFEDPFGAERYSSFRSRRSSFRNPFNRWRK